MHVKINLHKTKTKHIRVQLIEWIILIFLHACVHAIHIHCIYRLNFAMPSSETNGRPIILRKLSHARLAVVAMWYRQSNISDNDEDLAWFELRKLKKNLKKSYQSEISAWLFHPNISSVHAMKSIVQISVDLSSGTQYKQSITIHFLCSTSENFYRKV